MSPKLITYYQGNAIPDLPGTNIFHSTELFRIYEATSGYTPVLVVAYEEGRPVAKLLAAIHASGIIRKCEVFGTGEYFKEQNSSPSCPVTPPSELFSLMLQRLTHEVLRDVFLIEFRNLQDAKFGYKAFRDNHYFAINWMRVRNSLHSINNVEERFSGSRIRQVKKGLNNGAQVREAHSMDEILAFAQMLRRNYSSKIRRYFPKIQFFQNLETYLAEGHSRIFIVTYKGKIIGGSACIYSDDTAFLWFSGGMRKSYALQYPGILAVWKALEDAHQRGYRHLEFMDVGLPFRKHGYREFVLRFGGRQSSTRRWFRFRGAWLNRLLIKLF